MSSMAEAADSIFIGTDEGVKEPPRTWSERVRALGPGVLISGSVVGSGELIGAANVGATAGFVALWIIIFWIVVKLFVAIELARYTIVHQKTAMEAFSQGVGGPRFGGHGWLFWLALLPLLSTAIFGIGGVLGGQLSFMLAIFPGFSGDTAIWVWTAIFMIGTFLLLASAAYDRVEMIAVFLVAVFSFAVVLSVFLLQFSQYAITGGEIVRGLSFQFPENQNILFALSLGGLIGFAPAELIFYSYWCREKGYAAWTGPFDGTEAWRRRALGWISTMKFDLLLSSLITGIVTVCFFLMGAAVLNRLGQAPQGMSLATTLSKQFTELYGAWAAGLYLLGGFAALYSTYFVWPASGSRVFADATRLMGIVKVRTRGEWMRLVTIWVALVLGFISFGNFLVKDPVVNITFNGVVNALMFPIVAFGILALSYSVRKEVRASTATHIVVWLSAAMMAAFGIYSLLKLAGWIT